MHNSRDFDIYKIAEADFDYSSSKLSLPAAIAANSDKIIKVVSESSAPFYVFSEKRLQKFIEDILKPETTAPSFFDGMDTFETGEKIDMGVLDDLPKLASEYSEDDMDALKEFQKRSAGKPD